jgi:ribonuclease P protein component
MKTSRAQMKTVARLRKRAEFLRVQRQGRKWVASGLILQALPTGAEKSRFGLTVSKKLDKRAVGRNRMRRRLRAAAYDVLTVHAPAGLDLVLIGRPETASRPYAALCEDMRWCLEKMDLLKTG